MNHRLFALANFVLTLIFILILSSCGNKAKAQLLKKIAINANFKANLDSSKNTLDITNVPKGLKSIIGSLNWQDITQLSAFDIKSKKAKAAGLVIIPASQKRCSGFLISANVLMTNHHCIPSNSFAAGVKVRFKFQRNSTDHHTIRCEEFIGTNQDLDYTLVKCENNPGLSLGFLELESTNIRNESIYLIHQNCNSMQNPNCDALKLISTGVLRKLGSDYTHSADTLGGSSGAPVISRRTNKVVALHYGGDTQNGYGRQNYAHPMTEIVSDINQRFPEVFNASSGGNNNPPNNSDFEPNNNTQTAWRINQEAITIEESVNSTDVDYYKFNVNKDKGKLTILLSDFDKEVRLQVLDENLKILATTNGNKYVEKIQKDLIRGFYYLKVSSKRGRAADYEMMFRVVELNTGGGNNSGGQSTPPAHNGGNNGNSSNYTNLVSINSQYSQRDSAASSEMNHYKVTLQQNRRLNVNIYFSRYRADFELSILDDSGRIIYKSNSPSNIESFRRSLNAGTYFIRVKNLKQVRSDYRISVF